MGVGLTLVRAVVELHGGTVAASSAGLGTGSEFIVRLPLSREQSAEASSAPRAGRTSAERIVIVEDLPDNLRMLEVLLTLQGYQVQTAVDGIAGLEMIAREHPDVAIVDLGLPGIDGFEVARRLRRSSDNDDIYLVALTGYGQTRDREAVFAAGFDEHLVKPLQPQDLSRALCNRRPNPKS
jgi:two-component system CheB/CheR fusion protein